MAVYCTKDLSRLGRNSSLTGLYINFTFPKYNVWYIAINDHFDTIDPNSRTGSTSFLPRIPAAKSVLSTRQRMSAAFCCPSMFRSAIVKIWRTRRSGSWTKRRQSWSSTFSSCAWKAEAQRRLQSSCRKKKYLLLPPTRSVRASSPQVRKPPIHTTIGTPTR